MGVHWTADAVGSLHEMFDNSTYTEEDTRAFVNSFYQRADQHEHSHSSGPMIHERNNGDVRQLIRKKHRIVYRTLTDEVHILMVIHSRRQLPHINLGDQ